MLKGLGDIASIMKSAQQMQGRMKEIQESLADLRVEGAAGGGMVRVEANGQQKILAVHIEDTSMLADDREMLEDLIAVAVNQALDKARQAAADEMNKLTDGVNLPGLQDTLSKFGLGPGAGDLST